MTLYKQPKSRYWWFEIRKPDGTRIRKSTETSDRAKAEVIVRTFIMGVKREAPADRLHAMLDAVCGFTNKTRMTLDDVWPAYTEWLTAAGRELEKTTLAKRDLAIRRLQTWAKTDYPAALEVAAIDRATATAYASYLAAQGLKGKTRQHILGDLSTIWEALRRARDGVDNPWPLVRPEANDSDRGMAFTREQEKAVLDAAKKDGNGWHLASIIARYTGLRYSSVARLTWNEIDLKEGVLRHTPPKTKKHGITVIMPLVDPLLTAVYPRTHASNGPGLFSGILTAAKVGEGYTFHSWRHTFRTRLSEAGVSDDLAKRLGGWTEDATAARYDHAERVEELRAAVEKAK